MDPSTLQQLNSLIQLDIDAAFCYDQAIERTDDRDIAENLQNFRADHERHIDALSAIVNENGGVPPQRVPARKGYLRQGITALRSARGIEDALEAMETNEKTTTENYERAREWPVPPDVHAVLEKGWDDEKHHLEYIQNCLDAQRRGGDAPLPRHVRERDA
jgi:uncharacterized protein (TIGR02284 family)